MKKNLLISRMWGSLMFLCYSLVPAKLKKKKGHPISFGSLKKINLETRQRFHTTLSTAYSYNYCPIIIAIFIYIMLINWYR